MTSGAIATSHHLATAAGEEMLAAGGSAVDASIAAAAVLCVAYPNNVALGGDLVALVRRPDGSVVFVNATGPAPEAVDASTMRTRHGTRMPTRGVDTVTLPGGVRGWEELSRLGGRLPWPTLLEPAIAAAADGVPASRSVAAAILDERADLEKDAGCRAAFLPDGKPLGLGEPLRQPALAHSLRCIQTGGADEFYRGALARRWIAGLARLGSSLTTAEVARYRAESGDPLEERFLGRRVLTSPPNTQGFSLLRTLRAIREQGIDDPLGADAARLAAVFAANNAVRDSQLADPRSSRMSAADLVTSPAPDRSPGAPVAHGDTVGLVVADADGWAVSLVQSVYYGFGACVLEPETGILFQNRGSSFSLDADSPNLIAPGRRPRHTLMPVLVLDGDRLEYASATMGGQAQPQIHAHLLLRALAGASVHESTSAPRWVVGEQDTGDSVDTVTIEADVDRLVIDRLADAGFRTKIVPPTDELLGHSNLIRVTSHGFEAASDPRSDGSATVVGGSD